MPPVSPVTTVSLRRISVGRSRRTSPVWMPCVASCERVVAYSSLESSSAFDGMHPMRRHVPPSALALSTTTTLIPSWAARIAAT
jgi:hypothetical protein